MNGSRLGECGGLFEQLDFSVGLSGAASFSAEKPDETHHAAQRCLHRVPLAVRQIPWKLLNQRAGALASQAEEAEVPVHQLDAEEQIVQPTL